MRDDSSIEFKGRISGVISGAFVFFAFFIQTLLDVRRAKTGDGFHVAEKIVNDIAPVAEHIHDDATIVLLAVVPARSLWGNAIESRKDPIAKLAADTKDLAKETHADELLKFHDARQPELVLNDAVFYPGFFGDLVKLISH